jgi:elongation factor P
MANTSDFRTGLCIEFKNELFKIVDFQHVKPGKGAAYVRTKLKNLRTGKVIDNTFDAGEKIDIARIERRPYQFLYKDESGYHFMNVQTFDQTFVEEEMVEGHQFLKEGFNVEMVFHADNETLLTCELPSTVELEITYTEPGLRGDTATNTLKPATVETGAIVRVPLFIEAGEKIRVDTRTGAYMERVK